MIAAMICNEYEKDSLVKPCLQMLVYPMTDADMETESMKKYTDAPCWNSTNHQKIWDICFEEQYREASKSGTLRKDVQKELLPMHSVPPSGIPDTYIETAEFDCLHDEGIRYGYKLEDAGTKVEYNDTKGTFHGYDMALGTQIVTDSIKKRLSFLRRHF